MPGWPDFEERCRAGSQKLTAHFFGSWMAWPIPCISNDKGTSDQSLRAAGSHCDVEELGKSLNSRLR